MVNPRLRQFASVLIVGGLSICLFGCPGPDKGFIELSKQKQELEDQVRKLEQERNANRATILGYEKHIPTVAVLPQSRIDELYTVASLQFGRLTGGDRPDQSIPGDTMVKVYVVPMDLQNQALKAAGSFSVALFDLSLKDNNKLGQWDFDLKASRDRWYGEGMLYSYVLDCPWQTRPVNSKLKVHVTFTDALTQRIFDVDRDVTIDPPVAATTTTTLPKRH